MSDSLQDQLKALGLARNKPGKKHQETSRKTRKSGPKAAGEGQKSPAEFSLQKAYALKKQDEQRQTDQARKKKLAEDRQRRLLNNEIRSIVKAHRLNRDDADIGRNFVFRGRIRKLHVTAEQLKTLNAGELGIAYLSGGYHLLAAKHADAVRLLSEEHVVDLSAESENDGDYPVPDDVSW
jgi:uncharacterized protein YaiL (DUF2058 family)